VNETIFYLSVALQFLVSFVVFMTLIYVGKFVFSKLKSNSHIKNSKFLNLREYLPQEEFTTVRQVFYLIMILIFVANIMYLLLGLHEKSMNMLLMDIIVSLYIVINGDVTFSDNKLVFFLLVPFSSLSCLFADINFIYLFDYLHIFAFLYAIKIYYRKFTDYTETNSLGITILFLFAIVFVSFFITIIVESVSPLDSLVMVSNAFTSNGYSVLGSSTFGKINALVLVWSGFLLSGVGTATLAVAIVDKYADKKFNHLEELVKKNKKD
jgi:hypothetical protein